MSELSQLMSDGLDGLIAVSGEAVLVRGVSLLATVSEVNEEAAFGPGNLGNTQEGRRCTVLFPIRTFTPALRKGDLVTVRGKRFKVDRITPDQTSILLAVVEQAGN